MQRNADEAAIDELTEINLDDLFKAFGMERWTHSPLRRVFRPPAHKLARQVVGCDRLAGQIGFQAAAAWLLGQLVRRVIISGQASLPRTGPLLIVTNHPGLYDTVGLIASIPRPDLRIIAAGRPFLQALPHVSSHLLMIDEAASGRMAAARSAARYLRNGGAVLLFAGGKIEPDPASLPGAIAALAEWSGSVELFGRLVPEMTVVPAVVSGVLSPVALRHPLIQLRRERADRETLAAALQLVLPWLHRLPMRVDFGPPIQNATVSRSGASALGPAVLAIAARLMNERMR